MQGIVVSAGSIFTLANIELGNRPVNPDGACGAACGCDCNTPTQFESCACADIAPPDVDPPPSPHDALPAAFFPTQSGLEKVPIPVPSVCAEAWQPAQLRAVGKVPPGAANGFEVSGSGHPLAWAGFAVEAPTSTPTTAQYHPSHHSFESWIITLQNWILEGGSV